MLALPELGHVVCAAPGGAEVVFVPSLGRIATIGTPADIVEVAGALQSASVTQQVRAARIVLMSCAAEGDPLPLIGWLEHSNWTGGLVDVPGLMPPAEMVAIAQHLLMHGLAGKSRPGGGRGGYAKAFSVAEHIASAVVHLGLSREEAADLTMTELQLMIETKFPDSKPKDVPTRDEYREQMAALKERMRAKGIHVK